MDGLWSTGLSKLNMSMSAGHGSWENQPTFIGGFPTPFGSIWMIMEYQQETTKMIPSGSLTKLLKPWPSRNSGFTQWRWWFSHHFVGLRVTLTEKQWNGLQYNYCARMGSIKWKNATIVNSSTTITQQWNWLFNSTAQLFTIKKRATWILATEICCGWSGDESEV